jgi:hypothetical protein
MLHFVSNHVIPFFIIISNLRNALLEMLLLSSQCMLSAHYLSSPDIALLHKTVLFPYDVLQFSRLYCQLFLFSPCMFSTSVAKYCMSPSLETIQRRLLLKEASKRAMRWTFESKNTLRSFCTAKYSRRSNEKVDVFNPTFGS